ncbi:hypothetical protein BOTBODRAFT_82750, partial [Botryobasidium botryosum FD-172 SS1]
HSPGPQQQPQPPQAIIDPALQAAMDAQYHPVPLKVADATRVVCSAHDLEVCAECAVDFAQLNLIAKMLQSAPELAVPPPPNVMHPGRSQAVHKAKEEGNNLYKQNKYAQAIQVYNISAGIAASRPPWEASQIVRDELTVILANRSAANALLGDYASALVDADAVVQLKRPWSKGHYRKGKALVGLGQLEEAKEAVSLGLQFEPDN